MRSLVVAPSLLALWCHCSTCAAADEPASKQPANELSIGAVKDKAESTAVRLLAKLGDRLLINEEFRPTMPPPGTAWGTFDIVSRELAIDASDKGKFGSATFRYGVQRWMAPLVTTTQPDGPPLRDISDFIRIVKVHFGADTDRSFKNRDLLLELSYIPVTGQKAGCFRFGYNPTVGAGVQLGKRYRTTDPDYVITPGDTGGMLKRLKVEGRLLIPFSCQKNSLSTASGMAGALWQDLSLWKIFLHSENWRDFSEHKTYHKHALVIRIPTNVKENSYIDLRRDIGAQPVEFNPGAKYGINLTLAF